MKLPMLPMISEVSDLPSKRLKWYNNMKPFSQQIASALNLISLK